MLGPRTWNPASSHARAANWQVATTDPGISNSYPGRRHNDEVKTLVAQLATSEVISRATLERKLSWRTENLERTSFASMIKVW
jgi:hypothetical protein